MLRFPFQYKSLIRRAKLFKQGRIIRIQIKFFKAIYIYLRDWLIARILIGTIPRVLFSQRINTWEPP